MTRSVEKNRSATRPTKNGETMAATETVPKTAPASVPLKCRVWVRYVLSVTYHEPQMAYCKNIIAPRRVLMAPDIQADSDIRASDIGHRTSVIDHRSSAIGHRPSAIGHRPRPSVIDHRSSVIGHRPSAIGHRLSVFGHR